MQRYWDGTRWTDHVAPGVVAPPNAIASVSPEFLVQREAAAEPWARIAFMVLAFATCVTLVANVGQLSNTKRTFEQIGSSPGFGSFSGNGSGGWAPAGLASGWVALGANVMLLLWMLRASQTSHRLGIPAKRSAGWAAAGFLVPVISFWFPYQGMRDLFLPGDPHRELAKRWWAFHLGSTIISVLFILAYFASTAVAAILAGVAVMAALLAAMTAVPLVHAAVDHHARILAASHAP